MLNFVLSLLVWIVGPSDDSEKLRATAPAYLTVSSAVNHLWAARIIGALTETDPAVLLAIGWHESRYVVNAVTREPGGVAFDTGRVVPVRYSCGVMTPTPNERCTAEDLTLIGGYLAGARHLRMWLDIRRHLWLAVRSYAGAGERAERFATEMIGRAGMIRSPRALRAKITRPPAT
jgi:hypothetical protein